MYVICGLQEEPKDLDNLVNVVPELLYGPRYVPVNMDHYIKSMAVYLASPKSDEMTPPYFGDCNSPLPPFDFDSMNESAYESDVKDSYPEYSDVKDDSPGYSDNSIIKGAPESPPCSPANEHNYAGKLKYDINEDYKSPYFSHGMISNGLGNNTPEELTMCDPSVACGMRRSPSEEDCSGVLAVRDTNCTANNSTNVRRKLKVSIIKKKDSDSKSSATLISPSKNNTIGKPEAYTRKMRRIHMESLKNDGNSLKSPKSNKAKTSSEGSAGDSEKKRKNGRCISPISRVFHNNMEKKRRVVLADHFRRLHSLISPEDWQTVKSSKLHTLMKSKDVIDAMTKDEASLRKRVTKLRNENAFKERTLKNALNNNYSFLHEKDMYYFSICD